MRVAAHRRFFFEQKTAYEMRISDWSSDVCSSDLLYAARKLGLASTGHAARGTGSPPSASTTNLYLEPGTISPEQMIREVGEGLFVTEMIGSGANLLTGDYSRGAAGFWIENGRSEEHTSELQSLMSISYAVFCLKKK